MASATALTLSRRRSSKWKLSSMDTSLSFLSASLLRSLQRDR